LYPTRKRRCWG